MMLHENNMKIYMRITSLHVITMQSKRITWKSRYPRFFANGGYRLFDVISRQLLSFYTLAAEFYIQDVMNHVNILIYVVIPCVLRRQCLPLHPGCNGHVKENLKNALHAITWILHLFTSNVIDYMRFSYFSYIYMD